MVLKQIHCPMLLIMLVWHYRRHSDSVVSWDEHLLTVGLNEQDRMTATISRLKRYFMLWILVSKKSFFLFFSLKLNKACTVSSSICLTSVCISEPSIYGIKTPNKKIKASILLKRKQNLIAQEYLLKLTTQLSQWGYFSAPVHSD